MYVMVYGEVPGHIGTRNRYAPLTLDEFIELAVEEEEPEEEEPEWSEEEEEILSDYHGDFDDLDDWVDDGDEFEWSVYYEEN
jgi:hypothetical protein